MDRDERHRARPGQRLRERHAYQQRSDKAGPLRHGNRVIGATTVAERALDYTADIAHVLARGQLGDDAAPLPMDIGLRSHFAGPNAPRAAWIPGLLDDRRGRFVAG